MTARNDSAAHLADASLEENDAYGKDVATASGAASSRRRTKLKAAAYNAYIRSDAWRFSPARLAELLASGGRCRICNEGSAATILTVHHRSYDNLGCEVADDLTTLCLDCHDGVTDMLRRRNLQRRALPAPRDLAPLLKDRILSDSLAKTR